MSEYEVSCRVCGTKNYISSNECQKCRKPDSSYIDEFIDIYYRKSFRSSEILILSAYGILSFPYVLISTLLKIIIGVLLISIKFIVGCYIAFFPLFIIKGFDNIIEYKGYSYIEIFIGISWFALLGFVLSREKVSHFIDSIVTEYNIVVYEDDYFDADNILNYVFWRISGGHMANYFSKPYRYIQDFIKSRNDNYLAFCAVLPIYREIADYEVDNIKSVLIEKYGHSKIDSIKYLADALVAINSKIDKRIEVEEYFKDNTGNFHSLHKRWKNELSYTSSRKKIAYMEGKEKNSAIIYDLIMDFIEINFSNWNKAKEMLSNRVTKFIEYKCSKKYEGEFNLEILSRYRYLIVNRDYPSVTKIDYFLSVLITLIAMYAILLMIYLVFL